MSRSLFARLHRRFGRPISGRERLRRIEEHAARLREAMPVGLVGGARLAAARAARVAVIGGGFAGTSAAWFGSRGGLAVRLIEPRAGGGRVAPRHHLIAGGSREPGAEPVGTSHPVPSALRRNLGRGM